MLAVVSTTQPPSYMPFNSVSLYIQMEFCDGGSLRDVLHQFDTPLTVRIDYFRQVDTLFLL